jgi:hypothetical protein
MTAQPSELLQPGDPALEQLGRLSDGWGGTLDAGRNAEHRLAMEVGRALLAAGFELHDCGRNAPTGGVCLTPSSSPPASYAGVLVTWAQHDVLAHVEDGPLYDVYRQVQDAMNEALGEVLRALGFVVGQAGRARLVTRRRRP